MASPWPWLPVLLTACASAPVREARPAPAAHPAALAVTSASDGAGNVSFDWLPPDGAKGAGADRGPACPEGFLARPGEGVCALTTRDALVFDVPHHRARRVLDPELDRVGVRVRLRFRRNGGPFMPGLEGAAQHVLVESLGVDPKIVSAARWEGEPIDVWLPLGRYRVRVEEAAGQGPHDGLAPTPREGQLDVRGRGEATLDWDLAAVDWRLRVDGAPLAAADRASVLLRSPRHVASMPAERRSFVEPGRYDAYVLAEVDGRPLHAYLGERELRRGAQDATLEVRTMPFEGSVRLDEGWTRNFGARLTLRTAQGLELPLSFDRVTGAFQGRQAPGRYTLHLDVRTGSWAKKVELGPAMALDVRTVPVRGQVVLRGRAPRLVRRWFLMFEPEGAPGFHVAMDARGRFETRLAEGVRYDVSVEAMPGRYLVVREGYLPSREPLLLHPTLARLLVTLTLDGEPLPPSQRDGPRRGTLVMTSLSGREEVEVPLPATGNVVRAWGLPGRYALRYWPDESDVLGAAAGSGVPLGEVTLGEGALVRRSVNLRRTMLRGRVRFAAAPPRGPGGQLALSPTLDALPSKVSMDGDGRFALPGIAGARFVALRYECQPEDGCDPELAGTRGALLLRAFDTRAFVESAPP